MEPKLSPMQSPRSGKPRFLPKKEGHVSVYANSVQIAMSNWDMRFEFGEMETTAGEGITIQPKVTVTMSPQHAKAFAAILCRNITQYETNFGEIRIEPIKKTGEPEKQ